MDAYKKIKLRRVLPGVIAGFVLVCILLFTFYSLTPNQRSQRAIKSVIARFDFELIEQGQTGRTMNRTDALLDIYETEKLEIEEVNLIESTIYGAVNYSMIEVVGDDDYYNNNPRTYVFKSDGMKIAEILLMPKFDDGTGNIVTRMVVKKHK